MKTLSVWLLALSAVSLRVHAEVPVQVLPNGIQSVNGSDVNMGCTSPLVNRGGVMVCESMSHLVDGYSPDIDTSTSDWASQLVTVRKSSSTSNIPFSHVLLTFGFDTAVSLTGIELDLFLCPEWKIGAPYITVFGDEEDNLLFIYYSGLPFENYIPTQSSCDSLSTVSISFLGGLLAGSSYSTWHILVSQFGRSIDWVLVGEIRFLAIGADIMPTTCTATLKSPAVMSSQSEAFSVITSIQILYSTITHQSAPSPTQTETSPTALPTSVVPREKENDCTCHEEISSSAVIAVSVVFLLLIITLTTVILTQCLLIIRMRRSIHRNETYTEVMTSTTMNNDVPVSPNAYAETKMTSANEEVTYEMIK